MRPYSKFEVKEVLKCFYALNKLSSNNLREKCDYKNLEIIEKEKVRMYSKEELIIDF
jgi:ribosomal protein L40E